MIGSIYANHPEILLTSLSSMNDSYANAVIKRQKGIIEMLQKFYIRVFGIPEIGFQLRNMYFRQTTFMIHSNWKPQRILDIGSGIGSYVFDLCRWFPDAKVDGWEIDRKKLSFTKQFALENHISNAIFSYGDITQTKQKETYDYIVNIDVLEHIKDYKKALRNMYTLIKPGGFLYLHTPQKNQKRFFKSFVKWEHEDHVREGFSPNTLKRDLRNIGFTDIEMTHTFGLFGSLTWELNHMLLSKSFVLAGLLYPLLYVTSRLDGLVNNKKGLCISVVARKKDSV